MQCILRMDGNLVGGNDPAHSNPSWLSYFSKAACFVLCPSHIFPPKVETDESQ